MEYVLLLDKIQKLSVSNKKRKNYSSSLVMFHYRLHLKNMLMDESDFEKIKRGTPIRVYSKE